MAYLYLKCHIESAMAVFRSQSNIYKCSLGVSYQSNFGWGCWVIIIRGQNRVDPRQNICPSHNLRCCWQTENVVLFWTLEESGNKNFFCWGEKRYTKNIRDDYLLTCEEIHQVGEKSSLYFTAQSIEASNKRGPIKGLSKVVNRIDMKVMFCWFGERFANTFRIRGSDLQQSKSRSGASGWLAG